MINIKETEALSINKFLQNFTNSASKTLSVNLDNENYKSLEINILSSEPVESISAMKEENILYKSDYAVGKYESSLALVIPEELVANISDVLTGGKGEAYKGNLSEIELNAALNLFNKIFKEIEDFFKNNYSNSLVFSTTPKLLTKGNADYDNEFNVLKFDFIVKILFKINEKKEFPIFLLLKFPDLKEMLLELKLLEAEVSSKASDSDIIDIEKISDVKIDITAELGKAQIPIKYALELVRGSIVELDTLTNSEIKVYANGIDVARAQVVAVDENFALKITKIISPEERLNI